MTFVIVINFKYISLIGDSATLKKNFLIKNMATTARNKHRQMLKEAEAAAEAENILIQETTNESENDFNHEY